MILGTAPGSMVPARSIHLFKFKSLFQEKYGSAKDFLSKPFTQPCIWEEFWLKY